MADRRHVLSLPEQQPSSEGETHDWFSKEEAAHLLGVSVRTLDRRIARGELQKRRTADGQVEVCVDLDLGDVSTDVLLAKVHAIRTMAQQTIEEMTKIEQMLKQVKMRK